jgi:phosphoribosyl-ATP pyrophosphohydrolase/phosphoribosyl-AMP cyclohydrolase
VLAASIFHFRELTIHQAKKLLERTRSACSMSETAKDILARAKYSTDGLIPAVVQDVRTREVLMVAYMNEEALAPDSRKGRDAFLQSQSKSAMAQGRNLRNFQKVRHVSLDCDSDTLLVEVEPLGPACHTDRIRALRRNRLRWKRRSAV